MNLQKLEISEIVLQITITSLFCVKKKSKVHFATIWKNPQLNYFISRSNIVFEGIRFWHRLQTSPLILSKFKRIN